MTLWLRNLYGTDGRYKVWIQGYIRHSKLHECTTHKSNAWTIFSHTLFCLYNRLYFIQTVFIWRQASWHQNSADCLTVGLIGVLSKFVLAWRTFDVNENHAKPLTVEGLVKVNLNYCKNVHFCQPITLQLSKSLIQTFWAFGVGLFKFFPLVLLDNFAFNLVISFHSTYAGDKLR